MLLIGGFFFRDDLIDDRVGLFRRHLAVHGIVDQHDRSEAAGSEAADGFDGEEKIVRRALLVGELELLIEGVQNAVRLLDVAGGARRRA